MTNPQAHGSGVSSSIDPGEAATSRGLADPGKGTDMRESTVCRPGMADVMVANTQAATTARQATSGVEIVYYLRLPDGLIKIGTSRKALDRLAQHRRSKGASEVLAVEFGGRDLEAARHAQFKTDRVGRAEHFNPSDGLMQHIADLRAALGLTA